jgi:TfoX/Sxy family transcriptional regulator of competence genes
MTYDQKLVERVRIALAGKGEFEERKMFGGYFFLGHGKMCVCVRDDKLMVRIDPQDYEAALQEEGTQPMIKRHGPIIGSVLIDGSVIDDEEQFQKWINRALAHNASADEAAK